MRAIARVMTLLVVLGIAGEARAAGMGYVGAGEDILPVRRLTLQEGIALDIPFDHIGYRYSCFNMLLLDLWRWDGQYVAYTGRMYVVLTDKQVAELGGLSVPWRYRCPPGLLIIFALIEMAIVTSRRRRVGRTMVLGGVMFAIAGLFYLAGLTVEAIVPALVGTHHVLAAYFALEQQKRIEAANGAGIEDSEPPSEPPEREEESRLPPAVPPRGSPAPALDQDPFRSPPRTTLAVVQAERPSSTPLAPDASAEPPKLLR